MKKIMKVLCLMLVLVMVMAPVTSLASNNPFADYAVPSDTQTTEDIKVLGSEFYSIIMAIGYIVAVCMVVYMGIQWILATPAKKAELKGRMWSMAIGVILLVAGVSILGFISNVAQNSTVIQQYQ